MRLTDLRVRFAVYSNLRRTIGKSGFHLEVEEGSTLYHALSKIEKKYGGAFIKRERRKLIETIITHYNIFLNGKSMKIPDDLKLKLCDGDEIRILQPVGGG